MRDFGLSRTAQEKLQTYIALLTKWNAKINLVSKSTLADAWTRHVLDSVQVFHVKQEPSGHWVDLGSGGGFPGLVVAILADDQKLDLNVTLVESDQRKSTFQRTILRETETPATVITARIEEVAPLHADILSARALSDLDQLLDFAQRHRKQGGTALFPKGASWQKEVEKARESWRFDLDVHTSRTSPDSVILNIGEIARV